MNISKEAIEAARDAYESGVDEATRRGIESTSHYFGIKYALEAAAPLLMAQALRDSADDFKGEDLALDVILAGPDAVRHHLNSRADVMTRVPL